MKELKKIMLRFIVVALLIGCTHAVVNYENVIFEKTNEIFTNDGRWLITLIHDLKPYQRLMDKIQDDLEFAKYILKPMTTFYERSNSTGYLETFKTLQTEIDLINDTYLSARNNFDEYRILSSSRNKRSLLPIVGQAMNLLFGTITEQDIENVNRNIRNLASNQQQIIHDLGSSLTVLNLTRLHVSENRRSIMEIVGCLHILDEQIRFLKDMFDKRFLKLEQFIHNYLQFQMLMDEIEITTRNAVSYLENLKSELTMLSLNHLSTSTISPQDLKSILLDVEQQLPLNLELSENPRSNIWHFYKTLTCKTYIENDQIRIILKIPLLKTTEKYEVYRIHNLPLPLPINGTSFVAKYVLESNTFMISKDRTKYAILSENSYKMCSNNFVRFCNPNAALYRANLNKLCFISMFMNIADDIKHQCKKHVYNSKLPSANYMTNGIWIIITSKSLTFNVNCRGTDKQTIVTVDSPLGYIKLNNTCRASNKHFELPEYFERKVVVEMSDPLILLLQSGNFSKLSTWQEFKTTFPNLTSLHVPSHLFTLAEIPMTDFVNTLKQYKAVYVDDSYTSMFYYVMISLSAIILCIIIVIVIKRKQISQRCKRYYNCKRLANTHDSMNVSNPSCCSKETSTAIELSPIRQREGDCDALKVHIPSGENDDQQPLKDYYKKTNNEQPKSFPVMIVKNIYHNENEVNDAEPQPRRIPKLQFTTVQQLIANRTSSLGQATKLTTSTTTTDDNQQL